MTFLSSSINTYWIFQWWAIHVLNLWKLSISKHACSVTNKMAFSISIASTIPCKIMCCCLSFCSCSIFVLLIYLDNLMWLFHQKSKKKKKEPRKWKCFLCLGLDCMVKCLTSFTVKKHTPNNGLMFKKVLGYCSFVAQWEQKCRVKSLILKI